MGNGGESQQLIKSVWQAFRVTALYINSIVLMSTRWNGWQRIWKDIYHLAPLDHTPLMHIHIVGSSRDLGGDWPFQGQVEWLARSLLASEMSENHKCCVKHNQIDIPLHLGWRLSENFSCKITFYLENEIKCKYQKKYKWKW